MPITFTPQQQSGRFGPGLAWRFDSSLPGPFPSSAIWTLQLNTVSDNQLVSFQQLQATSPTVFLTPGISTGWTTQDFSQHVAHDETQVNLQATVQLSGAGPADDTGTTSVPWSNTDGIPALLQHTVAQPGQGLTTEQSTQLQETWNSTAQVISVDSTVPLVHPPAPPGQTISAVMPVPIFGLIVRLTAIDPLLVAGTPDDNYYTPGLAVATIFRGADIWMRVPVHTPTKMIPLFGDVVTAAVATITAATWLANMSYQVSFRAGCAGQVVEMRFP